jgi:phosphoribosylamine---glycine ligase
MIKKYKNAERSMLNILVIGSGGREDAIVRKLYDSESTRKIYALPGNPGMEGKAELILQIKGGFDAIHKICQDKKIDLVVVGPEGPLAVGIGDFLREKGINVFGPDKAPAMLEASKGFAKDFMKKYKIPTADYKRFTQSKSKEAREFLRTHKLPLVIKADGLAGGKGVIIATERIEALQALDSIFAGEFKDAGNEVVIEEFMQGEEASILAICDGKDYVLLASSQDHKRALDGDKGKNTGGMGAYAPAPIVTDELKQKVEDNIIKPTLQGMIDRGTPFVGCLYAGLMIDRNEPRVVEFNVRFGDPETQVVLPIFSGDFAGLLYSAAIGNVDEEKIINAENGNACCVIMASKGYPGAHEKGFPISGIEKAEDMGATVYHAGTKKEDGKIISWGGRVLGVTCTGKLLKDAIKNAYEAVPLIGFKNKYGRTDIGSKALKK